MHVAILGGAGCIGSALSRIALSLGHQVQVYDDLSGGDTGNVPWPAAFSWTNFEHGPLSLAADVVFNLASPIGPAHVRQIPVRTLATNWNSALTALQAGGRAVLASTAEVYGNAHVLPTPENYVPATSPTEPGACYVEAKRVMEALADAYRSERGVDSCIVRIFNTYGPHAARNDDRAVPAFIRAALRNDPIVVHGDGTQTRSLCYVDDAARGLWLAARTATFFGPVNIGNPDEVAVIDLARIILDLTGSRSPVKCVESTLVGATRRCPDVSLAKRKLNWTPTTPLRDGLRLTIDYIERQLRGETQRNHRERAGNPQGASAGA